MSSSTHQPRASSHRPNGGSSPRPASIAELAERALDNPWEEGRELKYYLRVAEKCRRDGREAMQKGDLENAFVQHARAATLVLEKLPSHRDYHELLSSAQRHNLGLVCTFPSYPVARMNHHLNSQLNQSFDDPR